MNHCSTVEERIHLISQMFAQPTHGLVSQLSRTHEAHASYRGIQSCLQKMHGINLSLGRIAGTIEEAGHRVQHWLEQQQAATLRVLALDEQYSSQRGKAYLNVVDVHSGQIWASVPPLEVDGESWTLLLWYLPEQGITRLSTVSDGG